MKVAVGETGVGVRVGRGVNVAVAVKVGVSVEVCVAVGMGVEIASGSKRICAQPGSPTVTNSRLFPT